MHPKIAKVSRMQRKASDLELPIINIAQYQVGVTL